MAANRTRDPLTFLLLGLAVLIPFIYYGIQIYAASFNPGYSFIHQVASELGSTRAARPAIFNVGIMLQGIVTLAASFGFLRAMTRLGINPTLSFLTFLAIAINGVQMLWAGYFPLPDRRHAGHTLFIFAATLLPILLTAALWKSSRPPLKTYFIATLILLLAMIPIMSGISGLDTSNLRGLQQRIYTLTVFPPIAVAAIALANRYRKIPHPIVTRASRARDGSGLTDHVREFEEIPALLK
jgi:hypothetical membrane protein